MNRHGTFVWYYREGHGARIRLPGEFGSPEFNVALRPPPARPRRSPRPAKPGLSHSDPASFGVARRPFLKSAAHLQKDEHDPEGAPQRPDGASSIATTARSARRPFRELTDNDIRALRDKIATETAR